MLGGREPGAGTRAQAQRLLPGPTVNRVLLLGCLALVLGGCASRLEQTNRSELGAAEARMAPMRGARRGEPAHFDGSLEGYVHYALKNSPSLRASYADWRAATERVPQARRLPDPVFSYTFFVRSVETRVGPQLHKFGISQAFPWPTKLTDGADAAELAARSAQQRSEAVALAVRRRVAVAFWRLWRIQRTREVQLEQKKLLDRFAQIVKSRVEVDQATLADLSQISLDESRIVDRLSGLHEDERSASAALVAAVGAPDGTKTPIAKTAPPLVMPADDQKSLRTAALSHPRVRALALMAKSRSELADSADADRYPGFVVGANYIVTGPARMPNVPDSGKDPISVMLAVKLPLWGGVYSAEQDEAQAESAAFRARESAARDDAAAALEKAQADLRNATRRVKLYRHTLVPQAQVVYRSTLTSYQTNRSGLANVLIAERDLLELRVQLIEAQADHAVAWATLAELVGRPLHPRSVAGNKR